jgi:hypothetical protein
VRWGGQFLSVACAALLAVAQGGCVVQSQYQDGKLVSRSAGFGVARLPDCDDSHSTLVTTSALGVGVGQSGLMLGAVQAERACIPFECKAVFWVKDPSVVDEVKKLVGDDKSMCVAANGGG